MKRKFLAALLTLVMLLSLVPVTALAAEEEAGGDTTPATEEDSDIKYGSWVAEYKFGELGYRWSDDAPNYTDTSRADYVNLPEGVVSLDKRAEKGDNPYEYKITLEVVMEEATTTTTTIGGAATVLAIDCSNSMKWCSVCGNEHCTCTNVTYEKFTGRKNTNQTYFIKSGEEFVEVEYCDGWHFWNSGSCAGGEGWYSVNLKESEHTTENRVADDADFYKKVTSRGDGESRLVVAKAAAVAFLQSYSGYTDFDADGSLKSDAVDLGYGRYLAIEYFSTNARTALEWVDVSTKEDYALALAAINNARADGGTNLDAALKKAKSLLTDNMVKDITAKNTVVLTDGEPTYYDKNGTSVKNEGDRCGEQTFNKTIESATSLKNNGVKLYTVCFASDSEEMTDYNNKTGSGNRPGGGATYGKITLADYLAQKIATQPENNDEQYAFAAADADELTVAFETISNSITTGLNAGTVVDILPEYVSTTDSGFSAPVYDEENYSLAMLDWKLTADTAMKSIGENGETIYTWTYEYTVTVDPDGIGELDPDSVPLNQPTTLTVKVDGEDVELGFPIPCVKLPTPATVDLNGDPETDDDGKITGYKGSIFKNLSYDENMTTKPELSFTAVVTKSVEDSTGKIYTGTAAAFTENATKAFTFADGVLTFNQAGSYVYTVTETSDTNTGLADSISVSYDNAEWWMNVIVTYDKDANAFEAEVYFLTETSDSKANTVTFYNTVSQESTEEPEPEVPTTGTLMLKKIVTGLDNATKEYTINVLDSDGNTVTTTTLKAGETSDKIELASGTYTISEADASVDGYDLNTTYSESATVELCAGAEVTVTVTNAYTAKQTPIDPPTPPAETGSIKITKVVEIDGLEALPENYAVTFAVKNGDETVATETISSFEKADNGFVGTATIKNIDVGTYEITEQNPPAIDGYRGPTFKFGENHTAVVTKDGTAEVTVTNAYISNQPSEPIKPPTPPAPEQTNYTVNHYISDDNGETYTLHASSTNLGDVGTQITAAGLVMTIEGYTYDHADPVSITVGTDETKNVLNLYYKKTSTTPVDPEPDNPNPPVDPDPVDPPYVPTTGSVDIRKTDAESGAKLAGATFALYRVTNAGDEFVKSVTTNSAGQATASGLTPGKYVAIETVAPEGYVLDDTRHEFTVTAGAVATKLTVTNDKSDSVSRHEAYIIGYPDGTVKPTGNLSRAEAATIFFRLLADDVREANMTDVNPFGDVPAGMWYNHAVSTLYELGIIDPAETFRPDDTITRTEFAALAARFAKVVNADEFNNISVWVGSSARYLAALGLSVGSFPADEPITRAEAMALVNRVLDRVPQSARSLLSNMITWPDNADTSAWFYIAVQEATNSHDATKLDVWKVLRTVRDWAALEF